LPSDGEGRWQNGAGDVWDLDVTVCEGLDGGAQMKGLQMEMTSANIRRELRWLCSFQLYF